MTKFFTKDPKKFRAFPYNYEIARDFTEYMRSLKFLREVSVSKDFEPKLYNEIIDNLKMKFNVMKEKYGHSETLKVHVIKDHFKYYFDQTGENFSKTNGENLESCYSSLCIHEERHKFHFNRKIGTPTHGDFSSRSITFYNSKRARMTPPYQESNSQNFHLNLALLRTYK